MAEKTSYLGLYFPWSLIVALLVAVLFAALGIIIFRKGMSKAKKPAEPKIQFIAKSFWTDSVREFLARYGYFPTDALSRSFLKALKVLQSFVGGHEFRYQIPWYMVMGAEGSGKSSLLNSLDLNLPVGRPHFDGTDSEEDSIECDWWFYDHGVVLDVSGKLILEEEAITSDEGKWDMLLNLLCHHRPKRPLDGIVLTISCEDLVGDAMFAYDDLRLRAEYMYMKLWQLQRKTGLRLPVYIAVTKCDIIPGFEQFCSALPKGREKEIFGWSNESALDTTFEPKWIDEAFETIKLNLYRIQQNIFAAGKIYTNLDGIFKFPFQFAEMKDNLQSYVNHIFKTSGYHEGYFLRGIYFTGDSGGGESLAAKQLSRSTKREEELQALLDVDTDVFGEAAEKPGSIPAELKTSIYFVDDLFEKRVFRELGIARPVSSVLLGNTSAMRVAKVGVASGTVVATLGLLNAADNLGKAKASLQPALVQINDTLSRVRGQDPTTKAGNFLFEQQAENLLETMTQLESNDLTSIFIPASWFSSVNQDIVSVMAVAFDEVIFESLSWELTTKANDLVALSTTIPVTEIPSKDGDPLKTEQFYRLRNFVYQIHALALSADRFNNIGITSNLEDVADIIYYLFKMRMPTQFFKNDEYYQRALKITKVRVFNFETYHSAAIVKLRKLYDEFQLVAFDPGEVIPGLEALGQGLKNLEDNRNVSTYDLSNLRNITNALSTTISSLNGNVVLWIDVDHFDPGLAYEHVMSTIAASPMLGADVASQLTNETAGNFKKFKEDLEQFKSPLMNGQLFHHDGTKLLAQPTTGATKLLGSLNLFFSKNFMKQADKATIITNVPEGSVLMWDSLRLNQAIELLDSYNKFINNTLLSFPKTIQPLLQKVASESLVDNLTEVIADAEVFKTHVSGDYSTSPEDTLLSQVQNYRATSKSLEKVLFALKANEANVPYSALRTLVTSQNYNLLTKLDSILGEEQPYALKDGGFSWWTGHNLASLEAFSVANLPELKGYLALQRERIRYLGMEFAAPVVSFLSDINKEGTPGNLPLVAKWSNIINELEGYDKKVKGNGLAALEEYVEEPLNKVTLGTCAKYTGTGVPLTAQNSYFIGILNSINLDLNKRCTELAGTVSSTSYTMLSNYFNANLSGKFPFVDPTQNVEAADVDPDDLRGFFDLMDDKAATIKTTLQQAASSLGSEGKRALAFIDDMDNVRKFFGGFLVKDSKMPYPQFDFTVDFRVNRKAEKAANQVVDWYVNVQDTTIDFRSKSNAGHWNLNDPIGVGFRWAANSPEQPQLGGTNTALNVFNGTATFSYPGKWGLVNLLKDQAAPLSDFATLQDNQPETLAFDIPLKDVISSGSPCPQTAKVFVRFKVKPIQQIVDSKTGAVSYKAGDVVTLPTFPTKAPTLPGV